MVARDAQAVTEVWVGIAGEPRYEVSSLGRVRNATTGRVLQPTQNWSRGGRRPGYFHVTLYGVRKRAHYVHHLVAAAFLGPRPAGHDIDHESTDRADNSAANLRYLPLLENRMVWVGPGRNDFDSRKHWEREAPEDHSPMTEQETEDVHRDLAAAGW